MTTPALNSRPRPIDGESFRGYLRRVATENGFPTASFLVEPGKHKFVIEDSHFYTGSARKVMAAIEPLLRMEPGELDASFDGKTSLELAESQRKQLYRGYAAICPACIQERPFIRATWDNALYTVCGTHGVRLIEACPACDTPISLNRGKIDTCPKCKALYSTNQEEPSIEDVTAQSLLNLLDTGKLNQDTLIAAVNCMARPMDLVTPHPPLSQMKIKDVTRLQYQAAGLMFSAAFRTGYANWLASQNADLAQLSTKLISMPLTRIQAPFKQEPAYTKILFRPVHYTDRVHKSSKNETVRNAIDYHVPAASLRSWRSDRQHASLSRIITAEDLSGLLGLRVSDLHVLASAGHIPALNTSRIPQRSRFDLDEVMAAFESLQIIEATGIVTDNFMTLSELRPHLKYFCASLSDVWTLIKNKSVTAYTKSDYVSFGLAKGDMYFALHQKAIADNRLANEQALAHWWKTSKPTAARACNALNLELGGNDFSESAASLISLNRIAHFTARRKKALRTLLAENGIHPIYQASPSGNQLDLYQVSDRLTTALTSGREYLGFIYDH
ncbi:TniQ family protein [Spongiibacter marinus]|uniref:TniQ family protein n=1 Tax=Spongiibacter marinus TaxID=354246 RepID=UPI0003FB0A55|nr:TniQ family protein [Spongiibacter marinus]